VAVAADWVLRRAVHWTFLEPDDVYITVAIVTGILHIHDSTNGSAGSEPQGHAFTAVLQLTSAELPRRALQGSYRAVGAMAIRPDPLGGQAPARRLLQDGGASGDAGADMSEGHKVEGWLEFSEQQPAGGGGTQPAAGGAAAQPPAGGEGGSSPGIGGTDGGGDEVPAPGASLLMQCACSRHHTQLDSSP